MEISISPYSTNKSRPSPHDYETKVSLFWERFYGWKFVIAQKMLDGYENDNGEKIPGIEHSGYAAMDSLFSYFEPLGKHLEGYLDTSGTKSGEHFKIGVSNVFDFSTSDSADVVTLLSTLWKTVRNGLYHAGMTGNGILISGEFESTLSLVTVDNIVAVNPHMLAQVLIGHVGNYRDMLLASSEASTAGQRFLARYNYENPVRT